MAKNTSKFTKTKSFEVMKKIVFLRINPNAVGGAERYLRRLAKALKDVDIETSIRSYLGETSVSSWKKALRFNAQVRRQKQSDELYFSLERVSCADIYRAGDGVHKIYRATKPFWWVNPLNFVYPYLEKRCFKNSKKIIANSNYVREQIILAYGIDESKIVTIYNGINLPQKVEKGEAKLSVCEEFGLDYSLPILLFVGNGFKRKGVKDFLRLVSKLKTPVNALIVGKDKNINSYKRLAKKLKIKAFFVGEQKTTAKFYEASDIFIFPTHYEPFSNVVLEALSFKNIVFTTAQNGASEILERRFVMSEPGDESVLELIDEILNSYEMLQELQEKSFLLSQKFSIEENASKTLEVINEVLNLEQK